MQVAPECHLLCSSGEQRTDMRSPQIAVSKEKARTPLHSVRTFSFISHHMRRLSSNRQMSILNLNSCFFFLSETILLPHTVSLSFNSEVRAEPTVLALHPGSLYKKRGHAP